ncbi:MAG: MBOAT family protein [Saccharospirillaceae bacterium]|nr:MBOAT family protein [Pseudomonadales bacterium]NRB77715.1 MBOAT family protein [Saccharospirillaceae bacterium]
MVFSSLSFLFLFLPCFLISYYLLPNRFRSIVIVLFSYFFYAWWRIDFLLLFVFITVSNYFIALQIEKNSAGKRQLWLVSGLVINLSTLAFFKYANFGVEVFVTVFNDLNVDSWLLVNVILPIGISFYIFQAISYLVDVYQKTCNANRTFIDFAAFISLFPQLIAGPVLRYKDIESQFSTRTHSIENFSSGCERFMIGFIKKVLIADSIAPIVNYGFALQDPTFMDAWLTTFAYTAQLYFDFSGYADMAIGLGLMMGFKFMENFNQPYISQSITEFWRRWHISLSSWLKDYLYIPLGGSRMGKLFTYRNLMLTMLLGGLWHGANWTFIVWGLWHGGLLALEKYFNVDSNADKRSTDFNFIKWSVTLFLVMLGWVVFRSENIGQAVVFYQAMFSFDQFSLSSDFTKDILNYHYFMLMIAWLLIIVIGNKTRIEKTLKQCVSRIIQFSAAQFSDPQSATTHNSATKKDVKQQVSPSAFILKSCSVFVSFVFSILLLIENTFSPFLYFQF